MFVNIVQATCPDIFIDSIKTAKECSSIHYGSVKISATAENATLTYTLNKQTNSTGIFDNLLPGIYTVDITSPTANAKQITITIPDYYINRPTTTSIIKNPACEIPGEIQFTVAGQINNPLYRIGYGSSTYSTDYKFTDMAPGNHNFSVLTTNGCIVDSVAVNLIKGECNSLVFPNAFTPNNDSINDVFEANQNATVQNFNLKIYNRSGMLIFWSRDITKGWDGRFQNKELAIGVYYWIATYSLADNNSSSQSGSVTLLR